MNQSNGTVSHNQKLQHAQTAESSLVMLSNSKHVTAGSKGSSSAINQQINQHHEQQYASGQNSSHHQMYANTQYYIQHGSQLLNRSLKGQMIRMHSSSSTASRKQRAILADHQNHNQSRAKLKTRQQQLQKATTMSANRNQEASASVLPDLNSSADAVIEDGQRTGTFGDLQASRRNITGNIL